ncbi:coiled-coil alpha-helical rod protein 1, partial [Ascaphus truei]|uniref:coiled-coil alpha-helical rod protein 1 n=1 Tax=Ascaphus truei TaxID=8439 RepID=UPI003F5A3FBE
MDEKLLDPPSVYCVPKGTGHSGLIPPSHFETRRVPAYSAPPWAELAQLRRENVELRGKQENNEGARARSRERDPPEAPPSESRALEIIAHQMREIRRLEGALADAQEREGELRGAAQEAHELRRAQSEGEHAEERRRRAEEAAARHRQEELAMMSERHKMEAETLRSRVQALEAEQRERREKQAQEMTCLRGELRVANQDKETLVEELGQSRLELDSQNSLVQQLRTYIGELVPDNRRVEEQKRERMELQSTIETLEKERESLQTSACLLHTRLSSLTHILSLQEGELCKKGVPGEGERSRLLLSQWREKVFSLMVQLKSEEINKENGSRKIREKILSLEHSLEASGQQQNILLHTLQDRTAELDMERVRSKSLQGELSDRNTTSARLHSRAEKAEQALLHLKQMIDGSVQALSAQDVSLRAALSRLVTLGQRVTFATKRVDTIQGEREGVKTLTILL